MKRGGDALRKQITKPWLAEEMAANCKDRIHIILITLKHTTHDMTQTAEKKQQTCVTAS